MKSLTAFLCLLFAAGILRADPYTSSIRQAKRASANETKANSALLDAPPATTPVPVAPPPANPAPNPMLIATLQNITNLCADLAALNLTTEAQPSPDLKMALLNDLAAAAQGTKPSKDSLEKVAGHLITATLGKDKMKVQQFKLARYLHASFNGAHLTAAQQQTIFADVKKILLDSGTPTDDITNLIDDLKAIAAETK